VFAAADAEGLLAAADEAVDDAGHLIHGLAEHGFVMYEIHVGVGAFTEGVAPAPSIESGTLRILYISVY
jgi:hypothetical protein